jgi:demethylmenaquinone methyltransferase/2-methoxy-6-polyprenyl-1,4-benzoquinol methylase
MSQKTDFGFKKINTSKKTEVVRTLFDGVAGSYDLMNDLMSLGLHRRWKEQFVNLIPKMPSMTLLDVAGGTGDGVIRFLKSAQNLNPHITILDLSSEMIQKGQDRMVDTNIFYPIEWVEGSAEDIPFEDNSFNVVTISFGLRNVTDKRKALQEMYRVLKPEGAFLCLEFSKPSEDIASLYDLYSFSVIPFLGKMVAQNKEAYDYLVESIRKFPLQEELAEMMREAGFQNVVHCNLSKGIVAIHRGWK